MRIGELAKRSGLSRDTLRFYERNALIYSEPSQSASNSYRNYPEELVERLEMIQEARDAGLSVADLKVLITHLESAGVSDFDVEVFIQDKIEALQKTMKQTQKFLDFLLATQEALAQLPEEWNR